MTTVWIACVSAIVVLALPLPATSAGFVDVLDTPAQMSALAGKSLLQAVSRAGGRLVAVGQRGHILVSSDYGSTWRQASVPVSSDLTSVYFIDDRKGWAVGHDGVVLNTVDGGDTWAKQLDGRTLNAVLVQHMSEKVTANPSSTELKALLGEAERYKEQGPDKPLLDVWFENEKTGYVVGAYNLILRTDDGGRNWEPWFERTENPKFFNLYAIRPAAAGLYIAGEGGLVLKLDPTTQRFRALPIAYNGSFFGVADAGTAVLVYGLRGNVYRSDDGGKAWKKVDAGLAAAVVGSTRTAQGATVLVDVGGRAAVTADGGVTFNKAPLKNPMPLTGIADAGEGRVALVGPRGVAVTEVVAR